MDKNTKKGIVVRQFSKQYDKKTIFENVSFQMECGFVYGLVAPNGFGKTTLMKCIAGLTDFTGIITYGEIEVGSHFNDKILYSPSTPLFVHSEKKVIEYLRLISILKGIKFEQALAKFRTSPASHLENSICSKLSTGQQKIFQIFLGLLSQPEVILFDEPFNGLDHQGRTMLANSLISLAKKGKLIVVSTHVFNDIKKLTDKFFIIKNCLLNFYENSDITEVYEENFPQENLDLTIDTGEEFF